MRNSGARRRFLFIPTLQLCIHRVYFVYMAILQKSSGPSVKTIVNVRTDATTKREAQKVFKRMGLDLSSGVNLYLTRVMQDKALPFTPGLGMLARYCKTCQALKKEETLLAKRNK